jgi:membrane protein
LGEQKRRGWRGLIDVLKQAAAEWSGDRSPQLAAALAYYVLFSVAPLLVLATALLAFFYGRQAASGQLIGQVSQFVGPRIAGVLQEILTAANKPRSGLAATVISTVVLIVGATSAFSSVQTALNQIWEVEPKPGRGILGIARDRLPTFLLLAAVGALLVASLALTAALGGLTKTFGGTPVVGAVLGQAVNLVVFIAVLTLLFSLVYKVLPDARIGWGDVWLGALVTSVLFAVGQLLIGLYLSYSSVGSAYGAAGSLVALLVWLNYSGQAFLFGAELTQVVAIRRGSQIEPSKRAQRLQAPCAPPDESVRRADRRASSTGSGASAYRCRAGSSENGCGRRCPRAPRWGGTCSCPG